MKKIISLLSAVMLTLPLFQVTVNAAPAEQLPFTLTAPEHVAITYLNGNDSPNTCQVAWSQNTSMSDWLTKKNDPETHNKTVEALNAMGYDDVWYVPQMDWSIDTTTDWHYNQYWDTNGVDENYVQHLSEWAYTDLMQGAELSSTAWVFRYMGNISNPDDTLWYGRHEDSDDYNGWKDVLKDGQYTIVENEGEKQAQINFTDHTVNVRMRWLVTVRKLDGDEVRIGSDWSEIASVGKGVTPPAAVLTAGSVPAPVIRDLRYADEEFNGHPVVAFYLDVPDAVTGALNSAKAVNGDIILDTQARVQNGEWITLQGDWELKSGEMKIDLHALAEHEKNITKDTPIELRCRYECDPGNGERFQTEFSNVLTFGAQDMQVTTGAQTTWTGVRTTDGTSNCLMPQEDEEKSKAQSILNGLWILLIIIAVIVLLLIIFLAARSKKEDNKK